MTNSNLDDVMRRVKKLLAIAEDSRADANEASAAAGMAERIMRKYQIEHADVIELELKRGGAESFASEDCGTSLAPEKRSDEASGWSGILAVAVAELHDCQCRFAWTQKYGKSLRFSGYTSDAKVARFTYVYLVTTMAAASRGFLKANPYCGRREAGAFRRGFNSALTDSLNKATLAKKAEMAEASTSRSLVLVKDDAVAKHFGVIRYAKSGRTLAGDGFAAGFEQGSRVDVARRGLSTGATNARIGA